MRAVVLILIFQIGIVNFANFDPWSLSKNESALGDPALLFHNNVGLSSINNDLPDDRAELQQPISKLHFRIAGLIGSVAAYWIAFCGAWIEWRQRWRGIALVVLGGMIFCSSLGAIVLTAYYP